MKCYAIFAAAVLMSATAGFAYQPDYFPLRPGNRWVYTQDGAVAGDPIVLEVVQGDVIDGRWYALVQGFPSGAAWLRLGEEDGTLYAYDAETKTDRVWVAFDAPEGSVYSTEITACNKEARIESRNAEWKGPIGEFNNALKISYTPACADAGISADVFLPYVGLVERTDTTIAGPRTYHLVYANLGNVTFVFAPELSFTVALDKHVYTARTGPPVLTARLTLRNTRLDPFKLTFPGQLYDLVIKDSSGNVVYRWSNGKAFPLAIEEVEVGPGELNYVIQAQLADSAGNPLAAGAYTAEGFLTNTPPERFAATVSFEIQPAP